MKTNLSSCVSYFKSQSLFFLFLNYYYFVGQAYGKKIVKSVPLVTTSGPVIYTNLIGFVPMLLLANVGGEYSKFWDYFWADDNQRLPPLAILLLVLGSVVGTGIGYSGWWCRGVVSATSFTLIGGKSSICLTINNIYSCFMIFG